MDIIRSIVIKGKNNDFKASEIRMIKKICFAKGMILLLACFMVLPTTKSYAWWGHHRHYDRPYIGLHVSFPPDEGTTVWSSGVRYYYDDGYYYANEPGGYVVVNPPVGTVITTAPSPYQAVVINGATYYVNNGVYYIYTPNGYQVVPTPVMVQQPFPQAIAPTTVVNPTTVAPTDPLLSEENSFTVNIPNDKGGYTAVVIKRSAKGFVGPQGEFYQEFPKVAQLKLMYGK